MPFTPLDAFLNGFEGGKTEKDREGRKVVDKDKPFTLWSFENKQKWWVDPDEKETFYKLYLEDLENTVPRYLTERSTPIGQLRVDLDFKYEGRVDTHRHTREQVITFAGAYMAEVKKYLNVPETVSIYILEKDYPTFDPTKGSPVSEGKHTGLSSSGIHLQVPDIKTKASVEQAIRRSLLRRMEEFFPDLKFCKTWDDVYDKQPLSHTNNWPLLGSKKPDGLPYKIKYILDCDTTTGEISVDTNIPRVSIDMIKKMSVRSTADEETEMTEYGKQNTHQAPEREVLTGVQRVVSAPRGRQADRTDQTSRGSSPGRMIIPPLTQELRDYYQGHVNNLASFRFKNYPDWVAVGQCLKNLHPDLNDLWHDFSSKYEDYKPSETENKWNSFGYRVDGTKLGRGSLRHWSREDNPDGYKQVEDSNVESLMDRSVETATENDVAQVIHAKYGDEFKCAIFVNTSIGQEHLLDAICTHVHQGLRNTEWQLKIIEGCIHLVKSNIVVCTSLIELVSLSNSTFVTEHGCPLDVLAFKDVTLHVVKNSLECVKNLFRMEDALDAKELSQSLVVGLHHARTVVRFKCNDLPGAIGTQLLLEVVDRSNNVVADRAIAETQLYQTCVKHCPLGCEHIALDLASNTIDIGEYTKGVVGDLHFIHLLKHLALCMLGHVDIVGVDILCLLYSHDRDAIKCFLCCKLCTEMRQCLQDLLVCQHQDTKELVSIALDINLIATCSTN